ncbi:MAG TPA: FGGY family carbohydrate kinase [Armatimonadota bacterium]|jgi:sugar (pentulose or hexulose) kinase
MPDGLLLGIDAGTTVLKAAVFDRETGRTTASATVPMRVRAEADGTREMDAGHLLEALDTAVGELRAGVGSRWSTVGGVGLAAQGGSSALAERETGRPRTPLVLWNDGRCYPLQARIQAEWPAGFWRSFSLRDEPGMGLARLRWYADLCPDLLGREYVYVGAGELLFHRMTGLWRQDACNALQIGCYNALSRELTEEPLERSDASTALFAPLRRGHETRPLSAQAAEAWGLRGGIPVAGPYGDHEAAFLASCRLMERPLQCSLGTAWVATFRVPKGGGGSPFQFVLPDPLGDGDLVVQPLLSGNLTWEWALALAGFGDAGASEGVFARRLLAPRGLVALPWLMRPNPVAPDLPGGACLLGLGPLTTAEEILRAVAEGMCHELLRVVGSVVHSGMVDGAVLMGGAAKGWCFRRILAGLFHPLPVTVAPEEDWAGPRGSLHTFGVPPSPEPAPVCKPDLGALPEELRERHQLYLDAYERAYGHVLAGQAYRLQG